MENTAYKNGSFNEYFFKNSAKLIVCFLLSLTRFIVTLLLVQTLFQSLLNFFAKCHQNLSL